MNNQLKNRLLKAAVAAAAAFGLQLLFREMNSWSDALGTTPIVVMTAALCLVFDDLFRRLDEHYKKRMEAPDPVEWDVRINGVKVGTVSDVHYAAMERYAYRDIRNAVGQVLNAAHVAMVALEKLAITMPLLIFWGGIALAVFSPNEFIALLHEVQRATPAAIASGIGYVLQMGSIIAMIAVMFMICFGYRFGFRNHYSEAVGRMIRQHCNTPIDGNVHLSIGLGLAFDAQPN